MKTTVLSLAVGLCVAPAAAQMTIERVAPENSVLIVGMPNVETSRERFANTPLYDLWMSDEMKALRDDDSDEMFEELHDFLDELGVDRNELSLPTGPMGMALYPKLDPDTGAPTPAMLAFADYGPKGEAFGAMVLAMLDRGEEDRVLEFEVKDILGREVYEVHFIEDEPEGEDEFDDFDMRMMPDPADMFSDFTTLYYMQDDNVFMMGSDLGGLTEAIDRMDGNVPERLDERDDFRAVMGQVGRDDMYMVLLTRDLGQLASSFDDSGMLMFVQPTIKAVLGDIRGLGVGARVDGEQGMLEGRYSLYMPAGKQGIARLMDVVRPRADTPSFVGPDTISYSQSFVQFDQVVDVIRSVVNSNPMMQMQGEEMMQIVEGPIADILSTLGTEVHMASSVTRPLTAESLKNLVAIEVRDTEQFENHFGQFAPQMGLEPRDFLGQRIYSTDFGGMGGPGMGSLAIGIGGRFAFVGPSPSVEQALRTIGQGDQLAMLEDEPSFAQSLAAIGPRELTSFSFLRVADWLEATVKTAQLQQEAFMEEIRREHPEWADEMDMGDEDDAPELDFDLMRRYVGPMASEFRATDDGFVGTMFLLAPENE